MLYDVRTPAELKDEWDYRTALHLGDEELFWDGGEPEDQYFFRRWSWVPGLLNKERSRWIELQAELGKYLDNLERTEYLENDFVSEMRTIFVNRFDPEKE